MATKKVMKPDVVRGGIAIPLKGKTNYYYMSGRKHKNGGIDIGKNPRTGLEVEDGEVMHIADKEIKVFSSVPFLNGKSPAQKVLGGENPTTVFREQENFKDRNGINDDGTRKKQYGGDDKPKFDDWYRTVPKEINDTTNYNLRRAYELLPYTELENWRKGKGKVHLRSVAKTKNGNYEFLKSKNHPTYKKEIEWYNSPDGESFRKEYVLDESTEYPTYKKRNKKAMGGLSRSKDYGSKSKPYPNVKSKDFAGGNRIKAALGLNDDDPKNKNNVKEAGFWDYADKYADYIGTGADATNIVSSGATLTYPNPYTAAVAYVSGLIGAGADTYQGIRAAVNKDWGTVGQNAASLGLSLIGLRALKHAKKLHYFDNMKDVYKETGKSINNVSKKPTIKNISNIPSKKSPMTAKDKEFIKGSTYAVGSYASETAGATINNRNFSNKINNSNSYPNKSNPINNQLSNNNTLFFKNHPFLDPNISKQKYKAGGVYSVTVNGETKLKRFPSTGSRTKAALGTKKDDEPKKGKENVLPFTGKPFEFVKPNLDVQGIKISNLPYPYKDSRITNVIDKNTGNEKEVYNSFYGFSPIDLKPSPVSKIPIKLPSQDISYNYNNRTKFKNYIKEHPNTVSDAIGLASNTIGGLISHNINRRMLDKLDYFPQPMARSAAKLKTRININPQLDKMRESLAAYENDINNSTSSSNVALARRQRARFANTLQTNNIYANRENTETELINKDRLNQQSVADANVRDYNTWLQNQTTFRNSLLEKKAENDIGLIETINSGIQNVLTNREKRNTEKQNVAAMSLANPDLPVEVLYEQGLISKRVLDAYRKAYRARKKENNKNSNV